MHHRTANLSTRVILFATPLLWIGLAFLHPHEPYEASLWLFVHFAQIVLAPFLAFAVWTLLEGIHSRSATVSRIALVTWLAFFSAYDAVAGIATGLLARYADGLSGDEQAAVTTALDHLFNDGLLPGGAIVLGLVTTLAWPAAVIAGGLTLRGNRARPVLVSAMFLSSLFAFHASYPAAIGLASLLVAEALWARETTQEGLAPARAKTA